MEKLDYLDFCPKFGLWADLFKPFIESKEMFDLYAKIKKDAETEVICPDSGDTFRAFVTTNPEYIKCIWYLMDPYPRMYKGGIKQANGIAMDCSNSPEGKLQPSLEKFYDAIEKDLGMPVERNPSLEYLHQQGCMMLNTDLTCKLNKTGSHEGLWAPFQKFFLEEVMRGKQVIYILAGKASQVMEKYISPFGNHIIKIEHPAAASYRKGDWNHEGIFNRINDILKQEGKAPIIWNKRDWDSDLPF